LKKATKRNLPFKPAPVLLTDLFSTAQVVTLRCIQFYLQRFLGMLQAWELVAFDTLMRSRPDQGPDPRLLIVTITENDFKLPVQIYPLKCEKTSAFLLFVKLAID
jgi:CHASE2 domain-containing sensor protein